MTNRIVIAALAATSLALAPGALVADAHEQEAPSYSHVTHFRVDPSHVDEWEDLGKKWVETFADAGMGKKWNWYTSSNNFDYVIVDAHETMASFDHSEEMQAEMAAGVGAEVLAGLQETAAGIDFEVVATEVVKNRPDLSFHSGDLEGVPGFLHVGVHTVRPGKAEEFEGLLKKVAEAWEQTGTPGSWDTHEVVIGQGSFVVVAFAESPEAFYANKHTGEVLTDAFGEEESKALYAAWRDCISGYDTFQNYVRPDLSYVAEMHMGGEATDEEGMDDGTSEEMSEGEES